MEDIFTKEVLYNDDHKCVPNGCGDFDFICPKNGKQFFVPIFQRMFIEVKCSCGLKITEALYNGLNPENSDYAKEKQNVIPN